MNNSEVHSFDSDLESDSSDSSVPRRIAYVVKRYPRFSETFVVNEILAHEAAGIEIDIFALRPPTDTHFQESIANVQAPVCYLPYSGVRANAFWDSIRRLAGLRPTAIRELELSDLVQGSEVYQAIRLACDVIERGIDHLHAHFATSATTVAMLASRLAGVPYSFTAHAKDIFHKSVDDAELERKIACAAAVVTVSDFNLCYLRDRFAGQANRIHRVYNGLDLSHFAFHVPVERTPTIIAVGRLVEKKGFADLIDACAILNRNGRQFQCEIIGTGELEQQLQTQIDALALGPVVKLAGPRPRCRVISALQSAAMFVAPCVEAADGNRDGLPTVLLEAMALGTPCISTSVTGIPEIVRNDNTGLLLSPNQPGELANAMERLLADETLGGRLAGNARELIENEFDIHGNTATIREILEACHRPRQSTPTRQLALA